MFLKLVEGYSADLQEAAESAVHRGGGHLRKHRRPGPAATHLRPQAQVPTSPRAPPTPSFRPVALQIAAPLQLFRWRLRAYGEHRLSAPRSVVNVQSSRHDACTCPACPAEIGASSLHQVPVSFLCRGTLRLQYPGALIPSPVEAAHVVHAAFEIKSDDAKLHPPVTLVQPHDH